MKPRTVTKAIVLRRTDFQEADRIITVITPDQGKVSLMVKGARRAKSKLAGGIELFSVSDITFLPGRKGVGTLISSRLKEHYADIVKDIDRTMFGYEVLNKIHRVTEDAAGQEFFSMLKNTLKSLSDPTINLSAVELWLNLQLLKNTGHQPNVYTGANRYKLQAENKYVFDYDKMCFADKTGGKFTADHIKLLRLGLSQESPGKLSNVQTTEAQLTRTLQLSRDILRLQLDA